MLPPDYLDRLPDYLVALYSQAELDIIADMARRISTYDYFIPAAEFQYYKLREMGAAHDEILKLLAALTRRTREELTELFKEAGIETLRYDDEIYRGVGKAPVLLPNSKALQEILLSGLESTLGLFENLTHTTANTATRQFEMALDRAYMKIVTGGFDYTAAIRQAIKELAAQGVTAIQYPTGHRDTLEVAVRRAILTGVNQTAGRLQDARAKEMDSDLVETTAHAGARPSHEAWQGKVFSRSGKHPKYPDFVKSTGYGTGPGLCGWNCRHNFFPFFEEFSTSGNTRKELQTMAERTVTYNGEPLSVYDASQRQRALERGIRKWKREQAALSAAGLDGSQAAAKVKEWQAALRDFINQIGLRRENSREQVTIPGKKQD